MNIIQLRWKLENGVKDSIEDGIGLPDWRLTICLFVSWVILFLTLAKGVQSSGKVIHDIF